MRILFALIQNLLLAVLAALGLPFRWLKSRRRPSYVRFLLRGDPPYRVLTQRRWRPFSKRNVAEVRSLFALREQLAVLARDPRVRGAVFHVDRLQISPAKADAILELFEDFRARGKEVIGYARHAGNSEYEVLCAADRIVLSPAGRLELAGYAVAATALGAGLERLGISAQLIRRGDYKTAPELFDRAEISPIHRQTVEHLLDLRFQSLLARISRGRRLNAEQARRKVDQGPYSAKRALAEGLCDGLSREEDLAQFLGMGSKRRRGSSAEQPVPHFAAYRSTLVFAPVGFRPLARAPRLAVVPIQGIIAEGEGGRPPVGPEIAGSEGVMGALRAARRDHRTSALLLYVNSPGGSAAASELILDEVRRSAKAKPVLAYFDRVAASGGYMAALGAAEIWGAPEALAGSIGVFGGKFEISRLLERVGLRRELITRGDNAALLSPSRPFTEIERRTMELEIEEAYQDFLEHVSVARGKSKEEIHARAEGRVYVGSEALQAGLIDRIGTFEQACRRALELAKAPSDRFEVMAHPSARRRIPLMRLMGEAQRTGVFALWLPGLEPLEGVS